MDCTCGTEMRSQIKEENQNGTMKHLIKEMRANSAQPK